MAKSKQITLKMTESQISMIVSIIETSYYYNVECNEDEESIRNHIKDHRIAKKAFQSNGINCLSDLK